VLRSASLINGTLISLIVLVVFLTVFRAEVRELASKRALEQLNDSLEEQVRVRTEQLVAAQKLAFLGQHAAELVHNLNNPLTCVRGYTELLKSELPDHEAVTELYHATARLEHIIRSILLPARRSASNEEAEIDLNEVIESVLKFQSTDHFFKHKVETTTSLGALPKIHGVWSHFDQILGNVVKNAVDALHDVSHRELHISSTAVGNLIVLRVSDTGPGIKPEHMGKLFDPFFTTKPLVSAGKGPTGTGLGLPSVKKMVESYAGSIEISSELGRGTHVEIRLPAEPARPQRRASMPVRVN
jgi:signal transduction histidine kinase